jgi:HSP20 family protein
MTAMRYRRRRCRCAAVGTERAGSSVEWWQLTRTVIVSAGAWRPRADVYETADGVLVTVELAGLEADDLDVQLFEDALIVEGGRSVPVAWANGRYHAAEIPRGRFRLRLGLPAVVDPDAAEARFERGLLELALPKSKDARDGR